MSHELRTPLNAIVEFSKMIARCVQGQDPELYREYTNYIYQSERHLHEIINDILDLAKVDAGKFELQTEARVDLRRIARGVLGRPARAGRGGRSPLGLRGGHGRAGSRRRPDAPEADPAQYSFECRQVYAARRSGIIAVHRDEDGFVVFEVRHTGPGMTASEIEIALEPFGQIDAGYARKREGTRLRLPLARRLVELHGGSLSIRSEKGRGTDVVVRMPADPESRDRISGYAGDSGAAASSQRRLLRRDRAGGGRDRNLSRSGESRGGRLVLRRPQARPI
jgi:two-component system, cell cycle sensor histidine kinase PleC